MNALPTLCSNLRLRHRYGSPAAQFKAFWDATGSLWQKGSLVGKAVTTFIGTGTQGGGQETTHLTCECSACAVWQGSMINENTLLAMRVACTRALGIINREEIGLLPVNDTKNTP